MAVSSSSASENNAAAERKESKRRSKCPGVRVVGGRIYDSANGKTCHQCRQKTMDFVASCKKLKGKNLCPINYCHKCLSNRYGEKAEEVALLDDWNCPKCRDICNCSVCRKNKGQVPTGLLVFSAKKSGFCCVSEMLSVKGPDNLGHDKNVESTGDSNKEPRKRGKENSVDGNLKSRLNSDENEIKKTKREGLKEISNGSRDDDAQSEDSSLQKPEVSGEIKDTDGGKVQGAGVPNVVNNNDAKAKNVKEHRRRRVKDLPMNIVNTEVDYDLPLPQGTPLTTVMGIELSPEDVGYALQFLEFCAAFGEVLNFKKVQAESVLRELVRQRSGRNGRPGQYSSVIRFHTQLVSLIQKDMGQESPSSDETSNKNSWFQTLGECISESQYLLKELPSDCFSRSGDGYDMLSFSQKLRLLTFLCDEALGTTTLRDWIDEQNSKFVEREKEAKEKLAAAKHKEKCLKQKLQNEVAQAFIAKNGAPRSVSENESIVAQIKSDTAQAHAEMLEAMGTVPKRGQKSEAVRTQPHLLDVDGRAFWKLNGYNSDDVLLQDMGTWDGVASEEKWFVYGAETKETLDKYFSSVRAKAFGSQHVLQTLPSESNEENI